MSTPNSRCARDASSSPRSRGRLAPSSGENRLFPGVAYPVPEGATVGLGDADAAVTVSQADGGAGTEGVWT